METFISYNPVKLFFGKNIIDNLPEEVKNFGKKALIITGQNSARKFGYLDHVKDKLQKAKCEIFEFSGIKPNPWVEDVEKAVKLCRDKKIDFIVALGGGSVIDSAKITAAAYANFCDPWDIMTGKCDLTKKIPLVVVLTFAGTGSEMNSAAVLQNSSKHLKIGYAHPLLFPDVSFLDPSYTITMPKEQTIYGIADMIAHSFEAFFAEGDAPLSDRFVGGLFNEVAEVAPLLLNDLKNIDYRARILWASTVALNGTLYNGRKTSGDWGLHALGHALSYMFDIPHGATLSLLYPAWLKHFKTKIPTRIARLGTLISGNEISVDETIALIVDFFKNIGAPVTWREVELCPNDADAIMKFWIHSKASGMHHKLDENDYRAILNNILD